MKSKGNAALWIIVAIAVLILGGILLYNLIGNDNDQAANDVTNDVTETFDDATGNNTGEGDILSRIIDSPESYYGQQVTVSGEIQDLYNQRVFKISDQTVGDELLVITRQPLSEEQASEAEALLEDNADVSATGTVRQFTTADVESEFGIDIPEAIETTYVNRPVLVAGQHPLQR